MYDGSGGVLGHSATASSFSRLCSGADIHELQFSAVSSLNDHQITFHWLQGSSFSELSAGRHSRTMGDSAATGLSLETGAKNLTYQHLLLILTGSAAFPLNNEIGRSAHFII